MSFSENALFSIYALPLYEFFLLKLFESNTRKDCCFKLCYVIARLRVVVLAAQEFNFAEYSKSR